MKFIILSDQNKRAQAVYPEHIREQIAQRGELAPGVISSHGLEGKRAELEDCEVIFSTWGMPKLSSEQIKRLFPNLKAVLYAAGTVQGFAAEFIDCSVHVCSAWRANAVPVAEYTFSQIILAQKGFFQSSRLVKKNQAAAYLHHKNHTGNYGAKIGVIGVGAIGSLLCEMLKQINCTVYAYDPFLSAQRAAQLGVELTDLKTIFSQCDVITNHLANKAELKGLFNYDMFKLMKPYSTFINTGRGDQVEESDLARAMREDRTRTAVLDVTRTDIITAANPMTRCRNVFQTPHIAGSAGQEVWRMSEYMIAELDRLLAGEPLVHEVTREMLELMA